MFRPWMGAAFAAVGLAPAPGAAWGQAQDAPPTIEIASPLENAQYTVNQAAPVSFTCSDDSGVVAACVGSTANGASRPGSFVFSVTARDGAGQETTATRHYSVVAATGGDVGGSAPAALNLGLGSASPLAPFIPGVAKTYTSGLTATVTSTAGDGLLTVADNGAFQTRHLVNGDPFLPAALQASAASANGTSAPMAPVGGATSPTPLLTYAGPVSNDQVNLTFSQAIGSGDALRTGAYGKTLTFTLSTTNPWPKNRAQRDSAILRNAS